MSGIELVGLAASVLQIADLGWKSSYKLYAFSKKVHDAGKSIELVSQDIAATGAILKQLGEELKKDEENTPASRLGTNGLIVAASKLVDECQTLFKEIDQGITGEEGSKVILGFKQKLKWSYLEPRVDLLRTNLERLKSSLALMLNVLIYAEQQRSRQGASVLKEQQKLVAGFAEQKNDAEKRIEELKKRIELPTPAATPEVTKPSTQTASADRSLANLRTQSPKPAINVALARTGVSANMSAVQIPASPPDMSALPAKIPRKPVSPLASDATSKRSMLNELPKTVEEHAELDHHCLLIENILEEVNSSKYALDHGLRYRLHDGVLELHWREWEPLRATHGDAKLFAILSRSPLLARHWYERSMRPAELNSPAIRSHSIFLPPPIPGENVGSLASQNSKAISAGTQKPRQTLDTYVAQDRSYGAYGDRQLTAEEEEEEDITALKGEISFMKQQDVSSTRNALQLAMQAEETGRGTLARLGAQGERMHNTDRNLDIGNNHINIAEDKAKELKTLDRSMFAVHVNNRFTAKDRRARRDEQTMDRHHSEREQREATREAAFKTNQRMSNNFKGIDDAYAPEKQTNLAERAKYQFNPDSEDEEMEAELEAHVAALGAAGKRLGALAALGTPEEMAMQEKLLAQVASKSEGLSGDMSFSDPAASVADRFLKEWTTVKPAISFNTERLKRIR